MAKVCVRPENGALYLDFFYRGVRCREQTALADSTENRKKVQEMRTGLESMLSDVGKALDETSKSPHVQQAKTEAHKTAESLRTATEHTAQELRPLILDALHKLNEELAKFVSRMEQPRNTASEASGPVAEPAAAVSHEPAVDPAPEPMGEPKA